MKPYQPRKLHTDIPDISFSDIEIRNQMNPHPLFFLIPYSNMAFNNFVRLE
jgi:hypothetical protein